MPDEENAQLFVNEEQDQYDLKTDQGYVLMSRSFIGSSTWLMGPTVVLLVSYLILKAAWKPWKFYCVFQKKEVLVQRGEVCLSITRMASEIPGVSRFQIMRALDKLEKSGFIQDITPKCVKGAQSYKHLKVCKYSSYQDKANYRAPLTHSYRTDSAHDIRIKEREEALSVNPKPDSMPLKKRGTRIPFTELNPQLIEIGKKTGLNGNLEFVFAKFQSYWQGVPGQKGTKLDWEATWRNWCLNEMQRSGSDKSHDPKRVGHESDFDGGLF